MEKQQITLSHDQLRELIVKMIEQHASYQLESGFVPPGHYFSPLPSKEDIEAHLERQRSKGDQRAGTLPAIDLREKEQLTLLTEIARFHSDVAWPHDRSTGSRYFFNNDQYTYSDAVFLFCMLRWLRPKRIIEVGSGFSSALMLDTRDRFGPAEQDILFIDPNPERIRALLAPGEKVNIVATRVQDVDLAIFATLSSGDVLFIDSSHVSKIGSDVNFLIHEVLTRLPLGVWVHIHDMFAGFEYPEKWTRSGMWWNEQYVMRAFLSFNSSYAISLWTGYLHAVHPDAITALMPLGQRQPGAQLWIRRVT